MRKIILSLILLLTIYSCKVEESIDDIVKPPEFIEWTSAGNSYIDTNIYSEIEDGRLYVTGEDYPYLAINIEEHVYSGWNIHIEDSMQGDTYIKYYIDETTDIYFNNIRLEITKYTSEYIEGNFSGDDAILISEDGYTEHTSGEIAGTFKILR